MQIQTLLRFCLVELNNVAGSSRLEAELLLSYTLKLSRIQLITEAYREITEGEYQVALSLLERRKKGEPVAYILGEREFWSLPLEVTADTLIPRPETEILVEQVLTQFPANSIIHLADLGTGSGAIALAIAKERPNWFITATDNCAAALKVAMRNAQRLNLTYVNFKQGDWCEALKAEQPFDVIVSNPPYIAKNDPHLCTESQQFEPSSALIAENDGLADLHTIIQQAPTYLTDTGWLFLEHGYNQKIAVQDLLAAQHYQHIQTYIDFNGHNRITKAQKGQAL